MYCSKCGIENSDQADYCKGCGAALRSGADWGRGSTIGPFDEGSPIFGLLFAMFICAAIFSGFARVIGFPWGFPWIPGFIHTPTLIIGLIFLAFFMSRK